MHPPAETRSVAGVKIQGFNFPTPRIIENLHDLVWLEH